MFPVKFFLFGLSLIISEKLFNTKQFATLIFYFIILITKGYYLMIIIHIQFTILLDYKKEFTYNVPPYSNRRKPWKHLSIK